MQSPLYWHPKLYATAMRLLYGKHYGSRYTDIARMIPERARVLEVCMGDARLYTQYLKRKKVDYLGLDINGVFVRHARKKGVCAREFDLFQDELPRADYVIMQGSLYQFIPHEQDILKKLLASARQMLIISEPVKNLSSSKSPLISWVAKKASATKGGRAEYRFQAPCLHSLFSHYRELKQVLPVAGKRELAGIFETAA